LFVQPLIHKRCTAYFLNQAGNLSSKIIFNSRKVTGADSGSKANRKVSLIIV